jgi:plastocyanin
MRSVATTLFIALTAIALIACSGSTGSAAPAGASSQPGSAAPAPAGGSMAISIKNFAFDPATDSVPTGSKITWTNNDTTAHTVTFDDGSGDSGDLAAGATFDHTFATAGTFAYHCTIHSSMHGTVTVTQ